MGAEGEHARTLLEQFHKLHPEIRIDLQTIPWSAAHEKLLTAFAGNALPDIFQLGNTWIPEFQAIGAIECLDSFIARSSIVKPDRYFSGIWETNLVEEKTYGIPWYVDTRVLFYRSDILRQAGFPLPPETWEEWLIASRQIKQLHPDAYAVFFPLVHADWQVPVILIMQNEGKILRNNRCYGAFDDPKTVEALQFYVRFFEEGLAPRNMSEVANIYQGFGSGFFTMFVSGPWNVNELQRRLRGQSVEWHTAPLPGKKNRFSVAGGSSLVIARESTQKGMAWKFIEFLSRPEIQLLFYRQSKDLPAVKAAWELGKLPADPDIAAFYQQLHQVQATPKIPEWEQIATKLQEHLEAVIYQKSTLDEAIQALNRDVDRILEKRRWLLAKKQKTN